MAYVRINMVEFENPEAMKENSKELNANAGSIFPEVQLIAAIATSDRSALSISIYPNKEAADKAIAQRDAHHNGRPIEVVMAHEGDLSAFFQRPVITISD